MNRIFRVRKPFLIAGGFLAALILAEKMAGRVLKGHPQIHQPQVINLDKRMGMPKRHRTLILRKAPLTIPQTDPLVLGSPVSAPSPGNLSRPLAEFPRHAIAPINISPAASQQAIGPQSIPVRRGTFGGLTGRRQLREAEALASLNSVAGTAAGPVVSAQDDKREKFLGEINVQAK